MHLLDPLRLHVDDVAVAVDDLALAGANSEHDNSEEIAEVVPAAVVGNGVDRDLADEQRHDPGDREDEAVPQAEQEAGRGRGDRAAILSRGAG